MEAIDYSKYEPLRLDQRTVITDVGKFLECHRKTYEYYKTIAPLRAKPYLERGLLARKLMAEIDEQEKQKNEQ
jgi:hypothetical protein